MEQYWNHESNITPAPDLCKAIPKAQKNRFASPREIVPLTIALGSIKLFAAL